MMERVTKFFNQLLCAHLPLKHRTINGDGTTEMHIRCYVCGKRLSNGVTFGKPLYTVEQS